MLKFQLVIVWVMSVLACGGCHGPRTGPPITPAMTAVCLSPEAHAAMQKWIRAGASRRAGCIANTGSMKPALDEHDIVIVEPRDFGRLRSGDIALINARWAGSRVAHRLSRHLPAGWWITCGDANDQPDPPMSEQDYAGAVVIAAIEKRTGRVRIFERQPNVDTIAAAPAAAAGGAFKSRMVCSREF